MTVWSTEFKFHHFIGAVATVDCLCNLFYLSFSPNFHFFKNCSLTVSHPLRLFLLSLWQKVDLGWIFIHFLRKMSSSCSLGQPFFPPIVQFLQAFQGFSQRNANKLYILAIGWLLNGLKKQINIGRKLIRYNGWESVQKVAKAKFRPSRKLGELLLYLKKLEDCLAAWKQRNEGRLKTFAQYCRYALYFIWPVLTRFLSY